jgi:hypothetical protein
MIFIIFLHLLQKFLTRNLINFTKIVRLNSLLPLQICNKRILPKSHTILILQNLNLFLIQNTLNSSLNQKKQILKKKKKILIQYISKNKLKKKETKENIIHSLSIFFNSLYKYTKNLFLFK